MSLAIVLPLLLLFSVFAQFLFEIMTTVTEVPYLLSSLPA